MIYNKTTTVTNNNNFIVFAALKLIEELYHEGKLDAFVYQNILHENAKNVDITQFSLTT